MTYSIKIWLKKKDGMGNYINAIFSSSCIYNKFWIMGSLSLLKEPYEVKSAVQQTTNNFANTISQGKTYRNGGVTI